MAVTYLGILIEMISILVEEGGIRQKKNLHFKIIMILYSNMFIFSDIFFSLGGCVRFIISRRILGLLMMVYIIPLGMISVRGHIGSLTFSCRSINPSYMVRFLMGYDNTFKEA